MYMIVHVVMYLLCTMYINSVHFIPQTVYRLWLNYGFNGDFLVFLWDLMRESIWDIMDTHHELGIYPLAIKHGVLDNPLFRSLISPNKILHFWGDFLQLTFDYRR